MSNRVSSLSHFRADTCRSQLFSIVTVLHCVMLVAPIVTVLHCVMHVASIVTVLHCVMHVAGKALLHRAFLKLGSNRCNTSRHTAGSMSSDRGHVTLVFVAANTPLLKLSAPSCASCSQRCGVWCVVCGVWCEVWCVM